MEISFRFNETDGSAVTINVPAGAGFTINVKPLGGPVPLVGGGLNANGACVHPPGGGVKEEHGSILPKPLKTGNPKVFFDMTVDGKPAGRIVMELFADTTPRTAENFRALCTGEKGMGRFGKPLHYKGSIIHELDLDYTFSGGDIIPGEGLGGESIYEDRYFEDENFIRKHTGPGILTMWNRGSNTNGSQFMICMTEIEEYDNDCVVVGQVIQGLDVIESIMEEFGDPSGCVRPSKPVVIADCGQIL
ncbi:unnamed protein product [Microthlaspi erraticum]|uniref:Peptidyl-prolyl cis-trans isomerase n=1 Tax=Microthlaspi erraticum TaxID=1685480 RepID=A0A6D2HHQ5_9BRAS|nr:unnamed protein product [Microthlaspi erraticum]